MILTYSGKRVDGQYAFDFQQIPAVLAERASKKAAKGYSGAAGLLIYLNINEFGIREREVEASFLDATAPAIKSFDAVWILWKDRLYHVRDGDGYPARKQSWRHL